MPTYGVVPEGFSRKPLGTTLAELEAANVSEFGPQVVQTSQSPLGQFNGIVADAIDDLWQFAEDVYQSWDVNQAEGARLDVLGKLRLLRRAALEQDPAYRKAISNQGRARIDVPDLERAVLGVEGVTYSHVFLPGDPAAPIPAGTLCVAVLGGEPDEIADQMLVYVVPGISTYGFEEVSTVGEDGRCRGFWILRPVLVPVKLTIRVRARKDANGCPPPSTNVIRDAFITALTTGDRPLLNGDDLDSYRVRSPIESDFPSIEVVAFQGSRDGVTQGENLAIKIDFTELATLATEDVTVVFV